METDTKAAAETGVPQGAGFVHRLVRRALCFFGRHAFETTQELSKESRRVACRGCGKVWAMNDDVRTLIPWDAEFHRLYQAYGVKIVYKPWEFRKPNDQGHQSQPGASVAATERTESNGN